MNYLVLIGGATGVLLLFLLSSASSNTDLFSHNYYGLLTLAGVIALLLAALVGFQVWQLVKKLKGRMFGARLTLRLSLFFIVGAILPGFLVYAVSVQFLGNSIESWFDVRVEKALEGSLHLGRSTLDSSLDELKRRGRFVGSLLGKQPPTKQLPMLQELVSEGAVSEISLFSRRGKLLGYAPRRPGYVPDMVDKAMLRETAKQGIYGFVDAESDKRLELRVIVLLPAGNRSAEEIRIVQLTESIPQQISDDAETVQSVYRDYQLLTQSRLGLKRLFGITLTLTLLIVLLSAIAAAFYVSEHMSAPLAALAAGTRAVAQGGFPRLDQTQNRDELGILTAMFNQMTNQLSEAKQDSEQRQRQAENAKAYLEGVLGRLSSGVLAIDAQLRIRSVNESAAQILSTSVSNLQDRSLPDIAEQYVLLRSFANALQQACRETDQPEWQLQIDRLGKQGRQVLLIRGARLSSLEWNGHVVVFDDITHLLQAERQMAWGEVARRLAHEIKNPLTPIQLSAERLNYKLNDKLGDEDARLLQRATSTIVNQVGALKNMVAEFADYARSPSPKMAAVDMHVLMQEVLDLYEASQVTVRQDLQAELHRVKGDATRLRQVLHNLLQNSLDAIQDVDEPEIVIGSMDVSEGLRLWVQDNGSGFPEYMLSRAFDPYVTTKIKGTGLGLSIVRKIVEEHGGTIEISNTKPNGTRVSITLPLLMEET